MSKLTDAKIKAIVPPAAGRKAYTDGAGLQLRVTADGIKSWSLQYRFGQQKKKVTLGRYPHVTLKDARLLAAQCRLDISKGIDPNAAKAAAREEQKSKTSVASVYALYAKMHLTNLRKRSRDEYERAFKRDILPAIGHLEIGQLKRAEIVKLVDRVAVRAPTLANRILAYLSAFIRWCVGRGHMEHNPVFGIPKALREEARNHVMSIEDVRAVFHAAETALTKDHRDAFQFLVLSGMRRLEVCNMRWSEVLNDRVRIGAERSKNKKSFDTPLTAPLRAILERRVIEGEYVFSGSKGCHPIDFNTRMKSRLESKTSVEGWRIHDLRRAAATYLEDNGVARFITEKVLNHSDSSVTGIYARSDYFNAKKEALECWNNAVLDKFSEAKILHLSFNRGQK